ncbi:MAG TPA: fused MFS/spermidine synthase [Thermoanaerobaculia bacterium]|nr:fused MFS/spermidine synthase [Thermoanaerobaculia bacterium]
MRAATIRISVFLAGAGLMALEILAFRVIGKNFGTALRETSVVISVFLLAMSIGYWAGGRVADRIPRLETFAAVLALAGLAVVPVPVLDVLVADGVYGSGLPLPMHSFLVSVILFTIPTILLASVSPIAIRLLARSTAETGSVAGTTSSISTAGSITGSLLAAFVLIDWFHGVGNSILAIGAVIIACSIGTLLAGSRSGVLAGVTASPARAGLAGLCVAAAVATMLAVIAARPPRLADYSNPDPRQVTIHVRETPYHSIRVREIDGRYRILSFGRFHQSEMDLQDPQGAGFEYTDFFHLPMVLRPDAERVLFLGLGGGTGPKQFLRDYPNTGITAVEIDPGVIDVAREYFALHEHPRLRIDVGDGRMWLKSSSASFDSVIIDAFTVNRYGLSLPWHLTTREFFRELDARTTPDATIVFNSPGPPDSAITLALMKTMRERFPYQLAFRAGIGNTAIFAAKQGSGMTADALAKRVAELRLSGEIGHPGLEGRVLQHVDVTPGGAEVPVLTDDHAPVDQLLRTGG